MRSAVVYSKPFSPTIWFLCNDENNLRGHVWCVIWNQRPGLVNLHLQHRERRCDASQHVTWTPIKAVCAVCCSKLPFCWVERRADSLGYQVTGVFTQGYYEICRARGHCVISTSDNRASHLAQEDTMRHNKRWDIFSVRKIYWFNQSFLQYDNMNMHLSDAPPVIVMSLFLVDIHKLKIPIGGKRLEKIQF